MAPTRHQRQGKNHKSSSASKKVHSGRVGRAEPTRSYAYRNKGKELMPSAFNAQKELFPSLSNSTKKELPSAITTSLSILTRSRRPQSIVNHPRPHKSRAIVAIQNANLEHRRAKQVRDGTTKRLQAMVFDPDQVVEDARFATTIPYKSARLDLQVNDLIPQRRKLEFSIAVGFWGFAASFTPVKIFALSAERFTEPKSLANLILANTDVRKAGAQIGIDLNKVTFVGYELQFPKGYRYTDCAENDQLGQPREKNTSFTVVQSGDRVLVNTKCAMTEFFWQAEHFASDENGRVLIQVIGRIGKTNDNGYENFDVKWRNDEEKELDAEEKKRYLERQFFVNASERKTLDKRMRAIEERSRIAVESAQARKQQMKEYLIDDRRIMYNAAEVLGQPTHGLEAQSGGEDLEKFDLDLDLDLDMDLEIDLI